MSCRILPEENALIYECLVEPIGDVSVDTLKNLLAIHKTNGKHLDSPAQQVRQALVWNHI